MDKIQSLAGGHPVLTCVVVAIAVIILMALFAGYCGEKRGALDASMMPREEDKPEMTKITILASDGKVIEEVTVESDTIIYDSADGVYIEYTNAEGKDVIYILGTHSVKMTDL